MSSPASRLPRAATVTTWAVRGLGTVQIVLGLALWSGTAYGLLPWHILNGVLLVLLVWALAGMGVRGGAHLGLVVFAGVWGLVTFAFGMAHPGMLGGSLHWIIQTVHLLVGIVLLGVGNRLGRAVARPGSAQASAPPA